jgi:hypothetical protein
VRGFGLPGAVLVLVLLLGGYVRLANLDGTAFTSDELNHYYASQGLERGEGPVLPSGEEFLRGTDFTHLVGFSLRFGDSPERAVRLPSAIIGVGNLIAFAVIAWLIGGPWVAVWSTLVFAIYPEAVIQSRHGRFYTYQALLGLLAFYAGWMALRGAGRRETPDGKAVRISWLWALGAIVALALATRVQIVTLVIAAGWGTGVFVAAAADVWVHGWRAWRNSVPIQCAAIILVGIAVTLLLNPELAAKVQRQAQMVAWWARARAGMPSPLFYYYGLAEDLPVALSFAPLVFLVVALRDMRLAVFLTTWFGVPLLLHSFVFAWKGDRFIQLAMPAFLLAIGIAAARGAGALHRATCESVSRSPRAARYAPQLASTAVVLVALALVTTTPAFNAARRAPWLGGPRWSAVSAIVGERPDLRGIPLGASVTTAGLYYWGRVDFGVAKGLLEWFGEPDPNDPNVAELDPNGSWWAPMGTPDYYAGVPVLTTPQAIRHRFEGAGSVLIGIDRNRWTYGNIEPSLQQTLSREAEELCGTRCGQLMLFHWRFEVSP